MIIAAQLDVSAMSAEALKELGDLVADEQKRREHDVRATYEKLGMIPAIKQFRMNNPEIGLKDTKDIIVLLSKNNFWHDPADE